jgi:hypothetical protein
VAHQSIALLYKFNKRLEVVSAKLVVLLAKGIAPAMRTQIAWRTGASQQGIYFLLD